MKRTLVIAGIVLALGAGGVFAYTRFRPQAAPARAGDPALAVSVAVGALARSETHRLTGEQIAAVLPLLRVLRDTDPNDVEASRALAQEIDRLLTPEQRAEVGRLRAEARARRRQRQAEGGGRGTGAPGVGGGGLPGVGPPGGGPGAEGRGAGGRSRADVRQRVLGRLIERLEDLEDEL